MPSPIRKLIVTCAYLAVLAGLSWLAFILSVSESCLNEGACSDIEQLRLGLSPLGLMAVSGVVLYNGVLGSLPGSRRRDPAQTGWLAWWFAAKSFLGATTASAVLISVLYVIMSITEVLSLSFGSLQERGWATAVFLSALVAAPFVLGLPVGRLLLRLTPPRPGQRPNLVAITAALAIGVLMVAKQFALQRLWGASGFGGPLGLSPVSLPLAFALGMLAPVLARHLRPSGFEQFPYVLMLRRFSSFADRSVLGALLAARPTEVQTVLLTPTRSRGGDWELMQICFAGLRWLAPLRSVPVYLRTDDSDWQPTVRRCIGSASRIVLDASEDSEAMRTEIDLIGALGRWGDTLVLTTQGDGRAWPAGATVVAYGRSWVSAWWRIPMGLVASFVVMIGVGAVLRAVFLAMPGLLVVAIMLVAPVYLYFFLNFLRPSLDRASARQLRQWARQRAAPGLAVGSLDSKSSRLALGATATTIVGAMAVASQWGFWFASSLAVAAGLGSLLAIASRRLQWLGASAALSALALVIASPWMWSATWSAFENLDLPHSSMRLLASLLTWTLLATGTAMLIAAHRQGLIEAGATAGAANEAQTNAVVPRDASQRSAV